jgi:hypothetical protein
MKSWDDIRRDATRFAREWRMAYDEKSQAQSFLIRFFEVFGIETHQVATFEQRVKLLDGSEGEMRFALLPPVSTDVAPVLALCLKKSVSTHQQQGV